MPQPPEYPRLPPSSRELPDCDGEPMETARHMQQTMVLIQSLDDAWRDRNDFYVGGNMFLYFSETQAKKNDFRGPDVFVALNTTRRERRSWVVWEEGGKAPDVVIELLSESTEHVDRGEKMRIYGPFLRIGEYFLFDPFSGVLEGYEFDLMHNRYLRKVPDAEGRLRCEVLGLFLGKVRSEQYGVDTEWLRWIHDDGSVVQTPSERANAEAERANAEAERANAEAGRANAEAERANAEAERASRLAAELEALRGKPPQ